MTYKEKLKYVGNKKQLFSVKNYIMTDGKSNMTRACDIDNGKGMTITILPDRCCDIAELKFTGSMMNFYSSAGITHPSYYDNRGTEFLRSFFAGFLTTCGLTTICSPSQDNGEDLGLHGRISNTPADNFNTYINEDTKSGDPEIFISGEITEARLFGDKISLKRNYKIYTNENKFEIFDTVKNIGWEKTPHMILYHFNYGYPLLCEDTIIDIETEKVMARNDHARAGLDAWDKFPVPVAGMEEQCYYHTMKKDKDGYSGYKVFNPKLGKGVKLRYNASPLDYFIQWKMPGMGDYVLGLEPGNCHGEGRKQARKEGALKFIEPGGEIKYHFIVTLIDALEI